MYLFVYELSRNHLRLIVRHWSLLCCVGAGGNILRIQQSTSIIYAALAIHRHHATFAIDGLDYTQAPFTKQIAKYCHIDTLICPIHNGTHSLSDPSSKVEIHRHQNQMSSKFNEEYQSAASYLTLLVPGLVALFDMLAYAFAGNNLISVIS